MFVIRDIFKTKPGKAKDLVAIFKQTVPFAEEAGVKNMQVMTDYVSTYWTVVLETEVEELSTYFDMPMKLSENPEAGEIMKGYMELVTGGQREIFKIE